MTTPFESDDFEGLPLERETAVVPEKCRRCPRLGPLLAQFDEVAEHKLHLMRDHNPVDFAGFRVGVSVSEEDGQFHIRPADIPEDEKIRRGTFAMELYLRNADAHLEEIQNAIDVAVDECRGPAELSAILPDGDTVGVTLCRSPEYAEDNDGTTVVPAYFYHHPIED